MSPAYWLLGLVVIAVIGLATLASRGRLGAMPALTDDRPGPDLPEGPLDGEAVRQARFAVVSRGYSMTQVDELLDRLAAQLDDDRAAEFRRLILPVGVEVDGPAGNSEAVLPAPMAADEAQIECSSQATKTVDIDSPGLADEG